MEKLGSGLKKVLLAGIGAVAVTGEKSKELLDRRDAGDHDPVYAVSRK